MFVAVPGLQPVMQLRVGWSLATVTGERLAEVSFVAAHAVALQRHLEFALNLPAVPGPAARLEIADVPGLPPIDTRVGAGAVILPNVVIGREAFIAAGSVVTRDAPEGMLSMGAPAKPVRPVNEKERLGKQ